MLADERGSVEISGTRCNAEKEIQLIAYSKKSRCPGTVQKLVVLVFSADILTLNVKIWCPGLVMRNYSQLSRHKYMIMSDSKFIILSFLLLTNIKSKVK